VIIYENLVSGKRAIRFFENHMHELGDTTLWTKDLWSFQVLDIPHVRREATEAAAMADVVILALDGRAELPDEIKAWMEKWAGRVGDRHPILIALFGTGEEEQGTTASTRSFLDTIAETAALTFLHTKGPRETRQESVIADQPGDMLVSP
jgi:hypothetical protein